MANSDVRKQISDLRLKYWEVAYAIGITETTLCVWLRKPLIGERKRRVDEALSKLRAQRESEG